MSIRSNSRSLRFQDMFVFLDKDGKPVPEKKSKALLLDNRAGSTTTIRLAKRIKRSTGEDIPYDEQPLVAVKWAKDGVNTGKILPSVLELEAKIMREIGYHEHILKLEDFLIEEVETSEPGRTVRQYWFIIQYAAGQDLLQWMRNAMSQWEAGKKESEVARHVYVHLSLPVIRSIARQTLLALAHMHKKNIWHRDCKPDNLFIRDEFPADLVDMVPLSIPTINPPTILTTTSSSREIIDSSINTSINNDVSLLNTYQSLQPDDNTNWDMIFNNNDNMDNPTGLLSLGMDISNNNNNNNDEEEEDNDNNDDTRIDSGNGGGLYSNHHTMNSVRYELWVRPSFARRRAGVNDSIIFTNNNNKDTPITSFVKSPAINTLINNNNNQHILSTTSSSSTPSSTVNQHPTIVNAASKDPIPYILLSDFDSSKIFNNDYTGKNFAANLRAEDLILSKEIGNRYFRAPEADTETYDSAVDIWSLGMTLLYGYCAGLELSRTGIERTLKGPDTQFLTDTIAGGDAIRAHGLTDTIYDRINEMVIARGRSNGIDSLLGDLLRRMLVKDPKQRITAEEALQHKFFQSYTHLQQIRINRPLPGTNTSPLHRMNTGNRSPTLETMSRSSSAGISNISTGSNDSMINNTLFEDTYEIILKPGEILTTRKDAFCLIKPVKRLSKAIPHPYLKVGDTAIIKWYDLVLMGETAHLEAEEVNERRLDRTRKPLKHKYLSTIYDVYSQYYPSLPPGKQPGDSGTENCHPSLILVMEAAKGPSLDQFLLKQATKAVEDWNSPDLSHCLQRANSKRQTSNPSVSSASVFRTNSSLLRTTSSNTNVSNISSPHLITPELAHIICGPYLAATIIKQILLAVQYLHSENQAHKDIRMYALLLRDDNITVQGIQCFPDNSCRENLLVQVKLELDLEPTTIVTENGARISRRSLPYIKLSPVNPIRAGDSYDYTDFVLHKAPEQRTDAALDLWAIGDLLSVMVKGIQIKPRLASPLDMERRSQEIHAPPLDVMIEETIDMLKNYDPMIHGTDTVNYITTILNNSWFQEYSNVIEATEYISSIHTSTTSKNTNNSEPNIPTSLPSRISTNNTVSPTPSEPIITKNETVAKPSTMGTTNSSIPNNTTNTELYLIIALLIIIIAYLVNDRNNNSSTKV